MDLAVINPFTLIADVLFVVVPIGILIVLGLMLDIERRRWPTKDDRKKWEIRILGAHGFPVGWWSSYYRKVYLRNRPAALRRPPALFYVTAGVLVIFIIALGYLAAVWFPAL
jgi:hypothetical protein